MTPKPMIPSMGGRELGPVFGLYIKAMPPGLDVVEVGAWLGAGTYELATAMRKHGHTKPPGLDVVEVGAWLGAGTHELATAMRKHGHTKSVLHVYDRFIASKSETVKAAARHRYRADSDPVDNQGEPIKLKPGMDTLPTVRRFLHPFPFVKFYKGDIRSLVYPGKKIGVLVIDAAKRGKDFLPLMKKLEPHLAKGATVFFMDFYYHKKSPKAGTECQGAYVKKSGNYTLLKDCSPSLSCAVFRYEG